MADVEYKVVPAPVRGQKARGVKQPEARFALTVETVLNEMAAEGWEFVRAEMLPSEERSGLSKTVTTWRNLLVFRRDTPVVDTVAPPLLSAPEPEVIERRIDAFDAAPAAVDVDARDETDTVYDDPDLIQDAEDDSFEIRSVDDAIDQARRERG